MTGLLDLPTEILTQIFLLAFYSYRGGIWRTQPGQEGDACVCQICPDRYRFPRRANPAAIPLNPLYVLSLTCKKLNPLVTPLLYRDVALIRYHSLFKFERTLIAIPNAAADVQKLIVVGGGGCLNVNEILRESGFEFILAKCQAVKEIWFEDLRGLVHVDPEISIRTILNVNPWPRLFSILAGLSSYLFLHSGSLLSELSPIILTRSSLPHNTGLPHLTSLGFENCDMDLNCAPPLPAITKLRCGHSNAIFEEETSHFPSLRHLTLSGEDPHCACYDFPDSIAEVREVVIDSPVSPREALRTAALIPDAKTFRFALVDTLVSRDYRETHKFRMPKHLGYAEPSFEKVYITLHLFDYMTSRQKILNGLDKLLRTLDSPYVHLTFHLSDDRTFTKAPSRATIIKRIKRCLPSTKELEVEIAEMDFMVEEEGDSKERGGEEKGLLKYFKKVGSEKEYLVL